MPSNRPGRDMRRESFLLGGRDTGLVGVSDEEIAARLKDPNTPKHEKQRLQKGRRDRNKQKREGNKRSK